MIRYRSEQEADALSFKWSSLKRTVQICMLFHLQSLQMRSLCHRQPEVGLTTFGQDRSSDRI